MNFKKLIPKILLVGLLIIVLGLTLKSVILTGLVITLVSLNINMIFEFVEYVSIQIKLNYHIFIHNLKHKS